MKNKKSEHIIPKTTPYKRNGRKLEFSSHKPETSKEESEIIQYIYNNNNVIIKINVRNNVL